jgi:F420H(2)-dependent quinone reductase
MSLSTRAFVTTLKLHQSIYEHSNGILGHRLLGMPSLMLRTTGRKSGLARTNALVYGQDGDRYLVCASNGSHHLPAAAIRPGHPDYDRLFAICNRANHGQFAAYQVKTERPLPVVVLTRVG